MTLRGAAALAVAAFAVHEVRYLLVPDGHADAAHGYLAGAPVLLAGLLALALGRSLAALGCRGVPAGRGLTWAAASGALLGVHLAQEGLERALAGGSLVDEGLLVVVPLCLLAGGAVAFAVGRAERLLADAGSPPPAPRVLPAAPLAVRVPARAPARVRGGLARHLAGRAPPAVG